MEHSPLECLPSDLEYAERAAWHSLALWLKLKAEAEGRILPDGGIDNCACENCAECFAFALLEAMHDDRELTADDVEEEASA